MCMTYGFKKCICIQNIYIYIYIIYYIYILYILYYIYTYICIRVCIYVYMYCTVVAHSLGGCGRNDQHLQDTLSNDSPRRGLFFEEPGARSEAVK